MMHKVNLGLDSLVNKVLWNEKVLYPENLAPKPADVKVIACTGSYTRSPFAALQGTLSGVVSFSKPPGSTTFQELWMVKLDDGNFCVYRQDRIILSC
jgi:hypothetical protein